MFWERMTNSAGVQTLYGGWGTDYKTHTLVILAKVPEPSLNGMAIFTLKCHFFFFFFQFFPLGKRQTSTNLLGDEVVEWLYKSCFTNIFASLTLWLAMLLTLVVFVHPSMCASIPLCSSKLHLLVAENQKENQVLCQGKEHMFLLVLGTSCCLPWCKSQLSIHAGVEPLHVEGSAGTGF